MEHAYLIGMLLMLNPLTWFLLTQQKNSVLLRLRQTN